MPAPGYQQAPHVSTEQQRQALDEMSRQLVERLNEMVREQHERAEQFAATQHSLSPLPQPSDAEPESSAATGNLGSVLQSDTSLPHLPPPPSGQLRNVPIRETSHRQQYSFPSPSEDSSPGSPEELPEDAPLPKSAGESGCGTFPTIVFIIIMVIIIRSCS